MFWMFPFENLTAGASLIFNYGLKKCIASLNSCSFDSLALPIIPSPDNNSTSVSKKIN